jgi:glycosyltransferase involved in cell wall biosynthesis
VLLESSSSEGFAPSASPAPTSRELCFHAEFSCGPGLKLVRLEAEFANGRAQRVAHRLLWVGPRGSRRSKAVTPGDQFAPSEVDLILPGDDHVLPTALETGPAPCPEVRAIAFYLPQFHPIPENDLWWGEGFTEWTNVRAARPRFTGHDHPIAPHPDLGYYDLTDPSVLEKQAALARASGVFGFCYYYYWFGGKRLLEKPLEELLASGRPDFPFCFCWANENWSRRWDGQDAEILIAQAHSAADDLAIIRDLVRALRDPRYIRVAGRPLLVVYRPTLLPDLPATFARWREFCHAEGVGELHLAGVKGFGCNDAAQLGLDALIEFPPNDSGATPLPAPASRDFAGKIFDYREVRRLCLGTGRPDRPLYRGVTPAWDNTARRKEKGSVFLHSSPAAYHAWLRHTLARIRSEPDPEDRLLFINAWNEWAEGCHLEPDARHGYAWLNATRRALGAWPSVADLALPRDPPRLLVLAHDAERAGAQFVLLALLRAWRAAPPPFAVSLVCTCGGPLRAAYEALADTLVLSDHAGPAATRAALLRFTRPAPFAILANTIVHGPLLDQLAPLGAPVITYCHELQKSIERWAPGEIMAATLRHSTAFLAASEGIAANLRERHQVAGDRVEVLPAFIEIGDGAAAPGPRERAALAAALDLPPDALVVFGAGTTDWRKGPDLFIRVAALACAAEPRLRFVWIGGESGHAAAELRAAGLTRRVRFLGPRASARRHFYAGHVFALTSREDPCPLVALEAADAGLPVVCFAGAGDIPRVLGPAAGAVVPHEDVAAFASAVLRLLADPAARSEAGAAGRARVALAHGAPAAASALAARLAPWLRPRPAPLVSVVVPNYNHARFLPGRLRSVAGQTWRDIEIILLDDASTDHSRDLLTRFAAAEPRARYLPNTANSGSPFKQWRNGLREARGRYVWIAESDDAAEPALLETLVARLEADPAIALACCQPRMMDLSGKLGATPDDWFAELDPVRWKTSHVNEGQDELARFLSRKNTILNASGVVFRNFLGIEHLVDESMRLCADWLFWARLLTRGKIAYEAAPLNHWRLQSSNARTRPAGELEWEEGSRVIAEIARLLNLAPPEQAAMLERFAARCQRWRTDAVSPVGAGQRVRPSGLSKG